jgi:hypothetical protein
VAAQEALVLAAQDSRRCCMRVEPPDHLTERVWQMLADAQTSAMTREEATEQAILFLRRNLSYLARRARRGHHTSYDELLARDLEAIARIVALLEPSSAATHAVAESEAEHAPFKH